MGLRSRELFTFTLLALLASPILRAQSTLPATNPTASGPAVIPSPVRPETPGNPAEIHFTGGKLEVVARGSSLNQIVRDIGRITSIAITGGVNDERVFGTYGPGTPGDVLSSLLDGTNTNMLLREPTPSRPGQLFLAPRNGSALPAASLNNGSPQQLAPRPTFVEPRTYSTPTVNTIPPAPSQTGPTLDQQTETPPTGPQQPETSAAPQTPQQIYQQLQRLQQSQPHP